MIRFLIAFTLLVSFSGCMYNSAEQSGSFKINGKLVEVPSEIDGQPVPPDPGDKGRETLLGIDSNNNGVRDDVERYIDTRFQGYEHANKERAIAMQYARAAQKILEYGAEKAMTSQLLMSNASECEEYYYEHYKTFEETMNSDFFNSEFKDLVFNTRERVQVYFEYNSALSGHVFSIQIKPRLENCDTDINTIEN